METILFRGLLLRHFDQRRAGEVGVFSRIHLTADASQPVFDAMGWDYVPECVNSCDLVGALVARKLTIVPIDPALRKQGFSLTCIDADDFQLVRVKAKDGESSSLELRFNVRSHAAEAAALLDNWMRTIGEGRATLQIDYESATRPEKQETAQDDAPLFAQASSEPAELVSKDEEGDVVRRFESKEAMKLAGVTPDQPALPTARQAAGRTPHLGARKAGRPAKGDREVQ
jgi:hypothetical protein